MFENLVFASGSVEELSYASAMRVLEKLVLLQKVKHFAGVGTCALEDLFLIFGLGSNELQEAFNEHLTYLSMITLSTMHDYLETFIETYVWTPGAKLLKCFSRLLESKSFDSDLTIRQLYTNLAKSVRYCY